MSNPLIYIYLLSCAFLWMSCEDVIDIQTEDAPTQLTVDAWLNNLPTAQIIRLTQSQPYFQNEFALGLSGASVNVISSSGERFDFLDMGDGKYVWTPAAGSILGSVGTTYTLSIMLDGLEITSTSTMQEVPKVDSISQEFREDELGGPDGIYAEFFARDLPGRGDTYWIKTYKNGMFLNKPDEINIAYDGGFDAGAELDEVIFIPPIRELVNPVPDSLEAEMEVPRYDVGDKIRVEIHSISLEAFLFLESARDQILNGNNTIFASPIANSRGNVFSKSAPQEILGVFCVSAVSSLEKTVE